MDDTVTDHGISNMPDFQLGKWTVHPTRDCIERAGRSVHLKPKAMAVLECLARAAGEVVTRQQLFDAIWPNSDVSDAMLTQCVVELRHALQDDARHPRYIETIPRTGFRLMRPVIPVGPDPAGTAAETASAASAARPAWLLILAGLVIVVAAVPIYLRWGVDVGDGAATDASAGQPPSIVVLPFIDTSPAHDQGWFADGLSAELIARLTQIPELRVIGQSSALSLKGQAVDLDRLSGLLGVRYVLEGSVARFDDRLRITAKLVDAGSGFNLWSNTYEGGMGDLFAFQQTITEQVTLALSIRLGVGEIGKLAGSTENVEAFTLLMQAWDEYGAFTSDSVLRAIDLANRAVALDPGYARAWASLALFYLQGPWAIDPRVSLDWQSLSEQALEEAARADPEYPGVLPARVNQLTEWGEWDAVAQIFEELGLDVRRMGTDLAFQRALFLAHVGRVSEAIPIMEQVRLLEPLLDHPINVMGYLYLFAGRPAEAIAEFEQLWRGGDSVPRFTAMTGLGLALSARSEESIPVWLDRVRQVGELPEIEGFAEAMSRARDEPEAASAWLRDRFEQTDLHDYWIALCALYLGDDDLALDALRRSPNTWALWNPLTVPVRDRPEFREAIRALGLEAFWRRSTWPDFCRPLGPKTFECS
jgi:TolB-like protein/DNA-binding winged helix-turn-helix (wHTH) protein